MNTNFLSYIKIAIYFYYHLFSVRKLVRWELVESIFSLEENRFHIIYLTLPTIPLFGSGDSRYSPPGWIWNVVSPKYR